MTRQSFDPNRSSPPRSAAPLWTDYVEFHGRDPSHGLEDVSGQISTGQLHPEFYATALRSALVQDPDFLLDSFRQIQRGVNESDVRGVLAREINGSVYGLVAQIDLLYEGWNSTATMNRGKSSTPTDSVVIVMTRGLSDEMGLTILRDQFLGQRFLYFNLLRPEASHGHVDYGDSTQRPFAPKELVRPLRETFVQTPNGYMYSLRPSLWPTMSN
jgi:hypothetical protein